MRVPHPKHRRVCRLSFIPGVSLTGHRLVLFASRDRAGMLKYVFLGLSVLGAALAAEAEGPLRIAAAADLAPVLPAILTGFERSTGIHAEATYQASAALTTQIVNGAPFDVFLSADMGYPKRLTVAGLADSG